MATALFPAAASGAGFQAASPVPVSWEPGMDLILRGPLGRGFQLPAHSLHLVLAALGDTIERLLAVLPEAMERGSSIAVCTDCPLPSVPVEVEIYPLDSLAEILPWAEFLVLDLPREKLSSLRALLGGRADLPGQVLIHTLMPCGGQAECGACAVQGRRRPRLVCRDGPVLSLSELDW